MSPRDDLVRAVMVYDEAMAGLDNTLANRILALAAVLGTNLTGNDERVERKTRTDDAGAIPRGRIGD